jgi:hypothetical protein
MVLTPEDVLEGADLVGLFIYVYVYVYIYIYIYSVLAVRGRRRRRRRRRRRTFCLSREQKYCKERGRGLYITLSLCFNSSKL